MQKWEYHLETIEPRFLQGFDMSRVDAMLYRLGEEGWELVTTERVDVDGTTGQIHFIFKRPI